MKRHNLGDQASFEASPFVIFPLPTSTPAMQWADEEVKIGLDILGNVSKKDV